MRRRRDILVDEPLAVSRLLDPEEVIKRDGPKASAWLVARYRRKLRREGEAQFHIDVNARTPPWFMVAVEFLKRRVGWQVVVLEQAGRRTYRVVWLGKVRFGRQKEVRLWRRN
jgi:hypothetical protein